MQKPKQAFRNHPSNIGKRGTKREGLEARVFQKKIEKNNSNSFHSFAPEKTHLVKRSYLSGLILTLLSSFFLFFIFSLFYSNRLDNAVIAMGLIFLSTFVFGIVLIVKSIIKDMKTERFYDVSLSESGIIIEGDFFAWNGIRNEEILQEGYRKRRRYFICFDRIKTGGFVKYPLKGFEVNIEEQKYLLHVYRKRNQGKMITKSDSLERKYINLCKYKKENYILGSWFL